MPVPDQRLHSQHPQLLFLQQSPSLSRLLKKAVQQGRSR